MSIRSNHLLYVKTSVTPSSQPDAQPLHLTSLVDSGASKTIICYNKLSTYPKQDIFKIRCLEKPITMTSAIQDHGTTVYGVVDLLVTLTDAQTPVRFPVKAYVVSGLAQRCFLGNDLLYNDTIVAIMKHKILINPIHQQLSNTITPVTEPIPVPLIRIAVPHNVTLLAMHDITPSPQTTWVTATPSDPTFTEPITMTTPHLDIVVHNTNGHYTFPIRPTVPIAANTIIPTTGQVGTTSYDISIDAPDYDKHRPRDPPQTDPHDIPDIFNDQIQFPEANLLPGYINADDQAPDEIPMTDKDLIDSVNYDHLPASEIPLYRQLIANNLDIFSRHSTDIPRARIPPATVEVKENTNPEDFNPKYIPVAKSLRAGAAKLLNQLLHAGVIKQTNSPVPCLSNCFVIKKPNSGKLRLILDGRCTNLFLKRYAASTSYTTDELLTKLSGRIISLADLSQSFFQLPLHPDAQKYFSFQAPSRKIYSLTRCSQGFHNSPLFLSLAMNIMLDAPPTYPKQQYPNLHPFTPKPKPTTPSQPRIGTPHKPPSWIKPQTTPTSSENSPQTTPHVPPVKIALNIVTPQRRNRHRHRSTNHHQEPRPRRTRRSHSQPSPIRPHSHTAETLSLDPSHIPGASIATFTHDHSQIQHSTIIPEVDTDSAPIALFNLYDDLVSTSHKHGSHPLHRDALNLLFAKLRTCGYKLNAAKIQLAPPVITILGMNFNGTYLSVPPARFKAWRNMKINTAKQVKSLVSSLSYFRSFLPSFSKYALPLLELTKLKSFKSMPQHQSLKENIISALERNSKRRTITNNSTLLISTDASKDCAAATLELVDSDRTELITSFSKIFTPTERQRNIFLKEAATIIAALRAFEYYLLGANRVTLRTDVRAISFLQITSMRNQTSFRLAQDLARFNLTIIHVPTHAHAVPDYLSRGQTNEAEPADPGLGLSPDEAATLLHNVYIKHGRSFTKQQALNLLNQELLRTLIKPSRQAFGLKAPSTAPAKPNPHTIVKPNFRYETETTRNIRWRQKRKPHTTRIAHNLVSIPEHDLPDTFFTPLDPAIIHHWHNNNIPQSTDHTHPRLTVHLAALSAARHRPNIPTITAQPILPRKTTKRQQQQTTNKDSVPISIEALDLSTNVPISHATLLLPDYHPSLLAIAERCTKNGHMTDTDFVTLQQLDHDLLEDAAKRTNLSPDKRGIICKGTKPYLPKILLRSAVDVLHTYNAGAHMPKHTVIRKLSSKFYRPKLKQEINTIYEDCFICSVSRPVRKLQPVLQAQIQPDKPRKVWYIDVMDISSPVALKAKCSRYALIAVDAFSNYTVLIPIANRTKETIAHVLICHLLAPFGRAELIISDREGALESEYLLNILHANNIRCHLNSPRHSTASKAERFIQIIKSHLAPLLMINTNYEHLLPTIMQSINSTPFSADDQATPELLFFASSLGWPNNVLLPVYDDPTTKEKTTKLINAAYERLIQAREKRRTHANRQRKERTFLPGELVYLREPLVKSGQKLLAPAGILHIIKQKATPGSYWLENIQTKQAVKRHTANIFPAHISERAQLLNPSWDSIISPKPAPLPSPAPILDTANPTLDTSPSQATAQDGPTTQV